MWEHDYFDDPTAAPRTDTDRRTGPDAGAVPDAGRSANPEDFGDGVWSPVAPAQDVMAFTDVAVDAVSQARIQQIATRLEELASGDEPTAQKSAEITELFAELGRLAGEPGDESPEDAAVSESDGPGTVMPSW